MKRGLSALLILLLAMPALAAVETFEFASEEDRQRYHKFTRELRCPKCQNQSLDDSDAPIASDLRRQLHTLIEDGKSDREITDFMLARYGDFILYRPRFTAQTALLWLTPALLLLIGAGILTLQLRRRKDGDGSAELSEEEQQRMDRLLREKKS